MKRVRFKRALICIGSILATGYLTLAFLPAISAMICFVVLICHELGHYLAAFAAGGQPDLPVFVPLLIGAIGITSVSGLDAQGRAIVALAGPMVGLAAAIFALTCATVMGSFLGALTAALAAVYEVWAMTGGSDGRTYRVARRQWNF